MILGLLPGACEGLDLIGGLRHDEIDVAMIRVTRAQHHCIGDHAANLPAGGPKCRFDGSDARWGIVEEEVQVLRKSRLGAVHVRGKGATRCRGQRHLLIPTAVQAASGGASRSSHMTR